MSTFTSTSTSTTTITIIDPDGATLYTITSSITNSNLYYSEADLIGTAFASNGVIVANNILIHWQSTDKEVLSWLASPNNTNPYTVPNSQSDAAPSRWSMGEIIAVIIIGIFVLFLIMGGVDQSLRRRKKRRLQSVEGEE
jgi:hypothetical protein